MVRIEHRPPTAEEKTILECLAQAGPYAKRVRERILDLCSIWLIALLFALFVGVPMAMYFKGYRALIIVTSFLFGIALGMMFKYRQKEKLSLHGDPRQPIYILDLKADRVEVVRCKAVNAIELEEIEDEGSTFFLDLGDGDILFLQGRYLYDLVWSEDLGKEDEDLDELEKKGKFPNREFNLVRALNSGGVLRIECLGKRFSPFKRLDPEAFEAPLPKDGEIFKGTLSTLEEDLKRLSISVRK
jgi:hypothetical protein